MRNRSLPILALALLVLSSRGADSQPVDYVSLWQGESNALDATARFLKFFNRWRLHGVLPFRDEIRLTSRRRSRGSCSLL